MLKSENKKLFGDQVNDHIEKLNALMGTTSGEAIDRDRAERVGFSTKLLEGSTRMLGLDDWSHTLGMFIKLLERTLGAGGRWDERLSQIVSEILETEEQMVAEILEGSVEFPVNTERFEGLKCEIEVLLAEPFGEEDGIGQSVALSEPVPATLNTEIDNRPSAFSTLEYLLESLNEMRDGFNKLLDGGTALDDELEDLEHNFGRSEFYFALVGDVIRRLGDRSRPFVPKVGSAVLLDGIQDFFDLHSTMRGWNANLEIGCDNFTVEQTSAVVLVSILESCLFDICNMYGERKDFQLEVRLEIINRDSYLDLVIADNGPDFLSDSRIDRDDAVAFYPGLRKIRGQLEECGGLLWIEPGGGKDGRFKFTFPHSIDSTRYIIFSSAGNRFAVPAHLVEGLYEAGQVIEPTGESRRHLVIGGKRIPVCRLDEIAAEEVDRGSDGGQIVVIGLAERRFGIYSDVEGQSVEGVPDQLVDGNWASVSRHFLHIGETESPVIDARLMQQKYDYLQGPESGLDGWGPVAGSETEGAACCSDGKKDSYACND